MPHCAIVIPPGSHVERPRAREREGATVHAPGELESCGLLTLYNKLKSIRIRISIHSTCIDKVHSVPGNAQVAPPIDFCGWQLNSISQPLLLMMSILWALTSFSRDSLSLQCYRQHNSQCLLIIATQLSQAELRQRMKYSARLKSKVRGQPSRSRLLLSICH